MQKLEPEIYPTFVEQLKARIERQLEHYYGSGQSKQQQGGQPLKMLIMLWVEVQRVLVLREATSDQKEEESKHSASEMVSWLLLKYQEAARRTDCEHADMIKKIIAIIGIKQVVLQTEHACHAKAYNVINQHLKQGEADNDLVQILV